MDPITDLYAQALMGNRSLFANSAATPDPTADPNSVAPSAPPSANPPDISQILLNRLNQPDPSIDRLNSIFSSMPQRGDYKPSLGRKIAAGLMAVIGGPDAYEATKNEPYEQALGDWATKFNAADKVGTLEVNQNKANLTDAIKEEQNQNINNYKILDLQHRIDLGNQRQDFLYTQLQDRNVNEQDRLKYLQESRDNANQIKLLTEQLGEARLETERALNQAHITNLAAETDKLRNSVWSDPFLTDDPANPGKKVAVTVNKSTAEVRPITLNGQQVGDMSKVTGTGAAGNKTPAQEQVIMDNAQRMLPAINDIRQEAKMLDQRGQFGVVMSRIRDLSAKLGTTGDPGQIESAYAQMQQLLSNDPQLSKDFLVGKFVGDLGLLAAGAGRMYGRSGGSGITMVNYMKSLLSSDSTLSMFNGRLAAVENELKRNAAKPGTPTNDKLNDAINKALGISGAK